jgi:T5orf172 domain-containing protein
MNYATVGGYIYILSNPRMKGLLKIGFSARPVQERIAELNSATGVPEPFELEAYFLSMDPEAQEQQIHSALAEHRVKGKEFFELQISKALQVAESVCKRPPAYLNPKIGAAPQRGGWDWGPNRPGSSAEAYDSNYEYKKRSGGF